ncbi:OmpA family protein [Pseudomonas borbori]
MLRSLGALLVLLSLTGCAAKSYVVLLESPDGTTGAVVVSDAKGTTLLKQKNQGVTMGGGLGGSRVFSLSEASVQRDFSAALAAQPPLPQRFLVYFKVGDVALTRESEAAIEQVFSSIEQRGPSAVSVIGHTDTMSGERWNERLGLRRAETVADLLRKRGLKVLELQVASHGESNLLVATPDEVDEPRNRRVEISVR